MFQRELTSIYCSKESWQQKFTTPSLCNSTSSILRDKDMFARTYVRVRKRRENEVMRAPNSQSQSRMNEPGFYRYWNNATNFKKSNKTERLLYEWRKIETLLRWEESNRIINTLLDGFLLVELHFGLSKGSPKYCRLVKIPGHFGWSTT